MILNKSTLDTLVALLASGSIKRSGEDSYKDFAPETIAQLLVIHLPYERLLNTDVAQYRVIANSIASQINEYIAFNGMAFTTALVDYIRMRREIDSDPLVNGRIYSVNIDINDADRYRLIDAVKEMTQLIESELVRAEEQQSAQSAQSTVEGE